MWITLWITGNRGLQNVNFTQLHNTENVLWKLIIQTQKIHKNNQQSLLTFAKNGYNIYEVSKQNVRVLTRGEKIGVR